MSRSTFQVLANGDRVLLFLTTPDGETMGLDLEWAEADVACKAWRAKINEAKDYAEAERVARDGAILLRSGVPVGFSNDEQIRKLTGHLAQHDRELRRYIKPKFESIPGGEACGAPTIVVHEPKE